MTEQQASDPGGPMLADTDALTQAVTDTITSSPAVHVPQPVATAAAAAAARVIDAWLDGADPRLAELTPTTVAEAAAAVHLAVGRFPSLRWEAERIVRAAEDQARRHLQAYGLLLDLDRCRHGRHAGDSCLMCPQGQSAGNPYLVPGAVLGFDYTGGVIAMPVDPAARTQPDRWFTRTVLDSDG